MNAELFMENTKSLIEERLSFYMQNSDIKRSELFCAMSHSLFAGGKRLRPALLLAICQMFKGDIYEAMPYACAIEMIHTYSLIHDDLPAMDNDDLRRGKPTCHMIYGEDMAILAGDGLLSYAFEIISDDLLEKKDIRFLKANRAIALGCGVSGMVSGQALDIRNKDKDINEDILNSINLWKTGGLIKAAMTAGAYIGGADDFETEIVDRAASKIGLAFQIEDDILDILSSESTLGKNTNQDEKNNKRTYVSLLGIKGSKEAVNSLSKEAEGLLKSLNYDSETIINVVKYLINRTC